MAQLLTDAIFIFDGLETSSCTYAPKPLLMHITQLKDNLFTPLICFGYINMNFLLYLLLYTLIECFTSMHLVYVRIPDEGIAVILTSIHLVYIRIPSKGITVIFTSIHWVYVRIPGQGSPYADANGMMMIPMKTVLVMRWVKQLLLVLMKS